MPSYQFLTIWKVQAQQEKVWDLIFNSDRWPDWWRGVEKVEHLRDGDANHVGAVRRYTWKSKLPYRLIFDMETTSVLIVFIPVEVQDGGFLINNRF
jgi:Polyketide cyclase / dehydrase and lipid transport